MDLNFNINEDHNKLLLSKLKKRIAQFKLGGGPEKIKRQKEKGKLTARERINYLLDSKAKSIEIGGLAGYEMYDKHGGCPCA